MANTAKTYKGVLGMTKCQRLRLFGFVPLFFLFFCILICAYIQSYTSSSSSSVFSFVFLPSVVLKTSKTKRCFIGQKIDSPKSRTLTNLHKNVRRDARLSSKAYISCLDNTGGHIPDERRGLHEIDQKEENHQHEKLNWFFGNSKSFKDFGMHEELLQNLKAAQMSVASDIQSRTLPLLLKSCNETKREKVDFTEDNEVEEEKRKRKKMKMKSFLVNAPSGSGKTFCYLIPIFNFFFNLRDEQKNNRRETRRLPYSLFNTTTYVNETSYFNGHPCTNIDSLNENNNSSYNNNCNNNNNSNSNVSNNSNNQSVPVHDDTHNRVCIADYDSSANFENAEQKATIDAQKVKLPNEEKNQENISSSYFSHLPSSSVFHPPPFPLSSPLPPSLPPSPLFSLPSLPLCVIIVPSRELAFQISRFAQLLSPGLDINTEVRYGEYKGESLRADILICTSKYLHSIIKYDKIQMQNLLAGNGNVRKEKKHNRRDYHYFQNLIEEEDKEKLIFLQKFQGLRICVLDEVDLLLQGDFECQMNEVFEALKQTILYRNLKHRSCEMAPLCIDYIFVGATISSRGRKSTHHSILSRFPNCVTIEGQSIHKTCQMLKQRFYEFIPQNDDCFSDISMRLEKLKEVLLEKENNEEDKDKKTIIFCNSLKSVSSVFSFLTNCFPQRLPTVYHSGLNDSEKTENLNYFVTGKKKTLVCTDILSRGLDIPNVAHVILFEFTNNYVNFIHRVGRVCRGGSYGRSTVFFDGEKQKHLIDYIRNHQSFTSETIQNLFSRKRRFTSKIKKLRKENKSLI